MDYLRVADLVNDLALVDGVYIMYSGEADRNTSSILIEVFSTWKLFNIIIDNNRVPWFEVNILDHRNMSDKSELDSVTALKNKCTSIIEKHLLEWNV